MKAYNITKKSVSESKSQTVILDEKAEILGLGINDHIFACAVISYIGAINETGLSALLCLGGLLIIVAALAVALIKLRCPFCRHFLGVLYSGKKTFCPYCGCKIDDE